MILYMNYVKGYTADEHTYHLRADQLHGTQQQGANSGRSLCEACNQVRGDMMQMTRHPDHDAEHTLALLIDCQSLAVACNTSNQ